MIKYYGGKTRLVKIFEEYLPDEKFENIIDLFVGGGVVLNYCKSGMAQTNIISLMI
jgi:site-specific DNA-adenine methylase